MKISAEYLNKFFGMLTDDDGDGIGADIGYIVKHMDDIAATLKTLTDIADTLKEALEWYQIQVKNQTLRDAVEYKAISLTDAAITIRILLEKWNNQAKSK